MTNPLVDALEKAFHDIRDKDLTLGARLAYVAQQVRDLSTEFAEAVDGFVARLELAGAGSDAPKVGEQMPDFLMPDDQGRLIQLRKLLDVSPIVVAFHRGHWCPYCRLNAVGLAEVQDAISPVNIVAISAETQAFTRAIKAESGARFPFLTDVGNGYALSLNLAVWVDDAMSSLIKGAGWDVPHYQGSEGWILPIPSVFVVGQDGIIKARHVDPDYRRRLELTELKRAALLALDHG